MPTITYRREIKAPPEVVFDLCRSIDFHIEAAQAIRSRAEGGQRTGLSEEGSVTAYSAVFFGCRFKLTMAISDFNPPFEFRDSMTRGLFTHFSHHYQLTSTATGCLLTDTFAFEVPGGRLGKLFQKLLIQSALEKAQNTRLDAIKRKAEGIYS